MSNKKGPKILFFDVETAPIIAYVWGLFDQNVGLNQIKNDWHILAWAAKWANSKEVLYMDQRNARNIEDDSKLLKAIWKLLDEADIVITQNGKKFDERKLNARFVMHGFQPPSSFKHIDTVQIARKRFGFTSNKLEYMTKKLCKKYKKLSHKKYPGFELWEACLLGDKDAWKEMELYNKHDVLALEELFKVLQPWDNSSINYSVYSDDHAVVCTCGSKDFKRNGYKFTQTGKFQRYKCKKCGKESRDSKNLLTKAKRDSILRT